MPNEIQTLLSSLDEAYKGPAWHGPSLRAALRGVSAKQAEQRVKSGRHNIWELTVHATYWKFAVRRQLQGKTRGLYNNEGRNWFQRPAKNLSQAEKEKSWQKDQAALQREHKALREEVSKLPESKLDQRQPNSKYTPRQMIQGAAFHDTYHAGQIQLVKRLK